MYDKSKVETFFKYGDFKKGLSYIESFLRKEPDNPEFLNDYGVLYSFAYDFQAGRKYLHKAIEFQDNYKDAILNLTELYIQNNLPFSAINVLKSTNISEFDELKSKLAKLESEYIPEKVTFYIPVYNVEKYIGSCIKNILAQTYPVFEILIIDDSTPDKSMEIAEQFKEKYPDLIKLITHSHNKGLAAVRNTAIENARGDFLATVDTDAVPEDTFLETIMMEFKKRNKEKVAGIGGKLLEKNSVFVTDRWREVHMAQHWGDKRCEPDFLYGSTSVYKIEALRDAGGFDEYYRTNFEDCDISSKLKAKGYKLIYIPEAVAVHLRKDNLESIVNTYYNWVATPYKRNFDNFEVLIEKKSAKWEKRNWRVTP